MQLRSSILDLRSSARPRGYPLSSILYPRPRPAFTIVELMISIALVVILMVGIHQVFKMSSDTVSMGHALADMARDNRSVSLEAPAGHCGRIQYLHRNCRWQTSRSSARCCAHLHSRAPEGPAGLSVLPHRHAGRRHRSNRHRRMRAPGNNGQSQSSDRAQ